jgi:hypothetical protein
MQAANEKRDLPSWILALVGGLAGGLCGLVSGPIVMIIFMMLEHYMHGTVFMGLELVGAPVIGSILGVVTGIGLGASWRKMFSRPWRLNIARLMLIVLVSGPSLALVLALPTAAVFVFGNVLAVLPLVIAFILAAARPLKRAADGSPKSAAQDVSVQHDSEKAGRTLPISDWGDPGLSQESSRNTPAGS